VSKQQSVKAVRYAEATYDGVQVVYFQTFAGTRHYITLPLDWYENGRLPADAMRLFCPNFPVSMYTEFVYMDRMYNIPKGQVKCENPSGNPFDPCPLP
jgi:hypothetical protein